MNIFKRTPTETPPAFISKDGHYLVIPRKLLSKEQNQKIAKVLANIVAESLWTKQPIMGKPLHYIVQILNSEIKKFTSVHNDPNY